jgi:hypothetical protein
MDTKTYQFITAVQTAILADSTPIASTGAYGRNSVLCLIDDAFDVATRIPENVPAHEAAMRFLAFRLGHAGEEAPEYPGWLNRIRS